MLSQDDSNVDSRGDELEIEHPNMLDFDEVVNKRLEVNVGKLKLKD